MHNANAAKSSKAALSGAKLPFWWALAVFSTATAAAWSLTGESLWLDELHTSWCVEGNWVDLLERSQAGNQPPGYMLLISSLHWTVRQMADEAQDWILRIPSVLAHAFSGLVLFLLSSKLLRAWQRQESNPLFCDGLAAAISVCWFCLDRSQLFYASEARAYALLQLVQFLGWLCTWQYIRPNDAGKMRTRFLLLWGLSSAIGLHLHFMAALAILWQGITLLIVVTVRGVPKATIGIFITALCTAAICFPTITQGVPVWQRRDQWQSFAGNTDWYYAATMFPLVSILALPTLVLCLDQITRSNQEASNAAGIEPSKPWCTTLFWLVAFTGPWLTAWAVTAVNLAPVFHSRYVLCSAIPLVALGICLVAQIRRRSLQIAAVAIGFCCLFYSQGYLQLWQAGQLIGWQRGENWRAASAWIEDHISAGDEIWCAAGLIEGENLSLPISEQLDEYLTFPFRGAYKVQASGGQFVEPKTLVADASLWPSQWMKQETGEQGGAGTRFLVCRAAPQQLGQVLEYLKREFTRAGYEFELTQPIQSFGTLSAASVRGDF